MSNAIEKISEVHLELVQEDTEEEVTEGGDETEGEEGEALEVGAEFVSLEKYEALYDLAASALMLLESGRPTGGTRWVLDMYGVKRKVQDLLDQARIFDLSGEIPG